jgi:hypothetical protein
MKVYEDLFPDWDTVRSEFRDGVPEVEPTHVYADYDYDDYSGWAIVAYTNDGKTFYVNEGSHCSCYGLEGQWDPTEMTTPALEKMWLHRGEGALRAWFEAVKA